MYDAIHDSFAALPLAHVINNRIFVVHGGLFSSDSVTLASLNEVREEESYF